MKDKFDVLEGILKSCKSFQSDLIQAEHNIDRLEKLIGIIKNQQGSDNDIEGYCLQSPILSFIPRSITNKFNSKTENIALMDFEKEYTKDIETIEQSIIEWSKVAMWAEDNIKLVQVMMNELTQKEQYVVNKYYIEGYNIMQIVELHNTDFPLSPRYDRRSIERIRYRGLRKMVKRLK